MVGRLAHRSQANADAYFEQTFSAAAVRVGKGRALRRALAHGSSGSTAPIEVLPAQRKSGPRGISLEVVLVAMRKRIRVLLFIALVAAVIVPVGFALSLESGERAVSSAHSVVPVAQIRMTNSPIVATTTAAVTSLPEVPEGAKLLVIGTGLFGLAAVMRRSSKRDV